MYREAEEEVIAVAMADDDNAARRRLRATGTARSYPRQTTLERRLVGGAVRSALGAGMGAARLAALGST